MFHPFAFGIGSTEVIIILIVIFIMFGHHLPPMMRILGRGPGSR